jgi:dTDP-4-amino-4,6-dideoxygalactose transaminase
MEADPFNFPQQEARQYGHLLNEALERIQDSGQMILGEGVRSFEAAFAAWLSPGVVADQVVGVANGTDALELALRGCGVGSGDGVLLPSHTAYATLAAVLRVGAVPIFVDLEPGRAVLSVADLSGILEGAGNPAAERAWSTTRPKALIAVHLYGESCDLAALSEVCDQHGLSLIEDCAQACGTLYHGRHVGCWGRFAAFSFYPTKNLAAFGDGGALVANRPEDVEAARSSRFYGWDSERRAVRFGVNSRLDELQAWVLLGKLADLPKRIDQRRQIARWYSERLSGRATLPADGPDWRHSYHLFVILVPSEQRERLLRESQAMGIPLGVHYPLACHQHPYVIERFGPIQGLIETERRVNEVLSLPLHPYLGEGQIASVCERLGALLPVSA